MKKNEFNTLLTIQIITLILVVILLFNGLKKENGAPINAVVSAGNMEQKITIASGTNYIYGDSDANNFLMVFSRYNCDFCRIFYNKTFDSILTELTSKHKIKVICRDLIGPEDQKGMLMAKVAEVARQTGHFPEVHKLLTSGTEPADSAAIIKLALKGGILPEELNNRLNSKETLDKIYNDYNDAKRLGIEMTPSFVLNGNVMIGYLTYEAIAKQIGSTTENKENTCKN